MQKTVEELSQIISQEYLTKGVRKTFIDDISFDLFRVRIYLFLAILRKNFPKFYEQRYTSPMQRILFFIAENVAESPKTAAALDRHVAVKVDLTKGEPRDSKAVPEAVVSIFPHLKILIR